MTPFDFDGTPGNLVMLNDISRYKQIEQELAQSEKRYSDAFDQSPVGIATAGLD
jgi:PAS domain-containing protein